MFVLNSNTIYCSSISSNRIEIGYKIFKISLLTKLISKIFTAT